MSSAARRNQVVVIDNGSGFTKVGYAGNAEPQDIFQSAISKPILTNNTNITNTNTKQHQQLNDLNYIIDHPNQHTSTHNLHFPIKHGIVQDWNTMEQLWQHCIYHKLRCNPEEHYFLLTEPPMNAPEHREQMAEIMFETFNIPGMHISIQAVLSLAASWTHENVMNRDLTGIVIDSGYGSTQIVPVVDGHVMSSSIEQYAIGGRNVTSYIQDLMRERKEPIPPGMSADVARIAKERYAYTVPNVKKELGKYDSNPEKYIKVYEGIHKKTGKSWSCNFTYERFMAPEVVLDPSIIEPGIKKTLPQMIDDVIMSCPIDTRRRLYSNIVLSGGNTVFKDFHRRLQRDVKKIVEARLQSTRESAGLTTDTSKTISDFDVNVIENSALDSSVWLGGSILGSTDEFFDVCHTKAQYEEEGSRIFRRNVAFKAMF